MKSEHWKQVDVVFHAALERDPNERAAFIDQACAGDQTLCKEVESLIRSHEQAQSFIESPAADLAAEMLASGEGKLIGWSAGPYSILKLLGVGGMGEVYLAEDKRLGRRVALKVLPTHFTEDPERLQRFEQEARAASMLNHPNIVTVHEIGQLGGAHFIVTEFIEGETLREQMTSASMRLREALDVAIQVATALGAAHKAGIAHRDIKPENIMLRPDGLVKVLDFGLAKLTPAQQRNADDEASTLARVNTEAGLVMGTVTYMSPEQARGLVVDARSDIFSLGVVLYEMVAGRAPFEGSTVSDVIAAILKEHPAPLRQYSRRVPAELEWVMKKLLAKDREERYQTIRELQIDLKRLAQELQSQAKLEDIPSRRSDEVTPDQASKTLGGESNLNRTDSGAGTMVIESQRRKRRLAVVWMKVAAAVAVTVVIFVVSFFAGLRQASPLRPSYRQLTFRRGTITSARFGPDGQTVVYGAAFGGRPMELFTSRFEGPESGTLKLHGDIKSISPSGEMAILLDCELNWGECHNGTLARVPVVGGTPREMAENVYEADWSPDGKELAIVRAVDEKYQLEYPINTVLYKKPLGWIGTIRVSPRGDRVAFIDHPILGQIEGSIMVVDLNGQTKELCAPSPEIRSLAWSADGDEIWFSVAKGLFEGEGSLHAVTVNGRERALQTNEVFYIHDVFRDGRALLTKVQDGGSRMMAFSAGSEKELDLSWFNWSTSADISADGKTLLFYEWRSPSYTTPYVYLRKLDGSNDPFRIGQGKALALSPDGKRAIALQEGPPPQLVLLPTGVGEQQMLPRGDIAEYHYASWFPDGQRILFTGLEEGHSMRSYVQDVSNGQMRAITDEGIVALLVSPDGKRLLTWAPDGKYYVAPTNGTAATPISGLDLGEVPIQWTADGRAIYVRSPDDSDVQIYRVELSDGRRTLWKDHIVPDPVGLLGVEVKPGGIKITPDGKSYVYTYWHKFDQLFLVEGLK